MIITGLVQMTFNANIIKQSIQKTSIGIILLNLLHCRKSLVSSKYRKVSTLRNLDVELQSSICSLLIPCMNCSGAIFLLCPAAESGEQLNACNCNSRYC